MERELKKFKTTSGIEVELKTYLTYGETREIQAIFLEGVDVSVDSEGKTKMPKLNASLTMKAQDKAIEVIVVSVNGNKDDVVKQVMDLRKEDAEEILAELDTVQESMTVQKKTK